MIRFQRTGRTNDPAFRIVVSEKARHPKAGNPLQVVGSYHPKTKHTVINAEAAKGWVAKGAQLSGTVHNLFISQGIIEGKKINVRGAKVAPAVPADKATSAPVAPTEEKIETTEEATATAEAEVPVAAAEEKTETPA